MKLWPRRDAEREAAGPLRAVVAERRRLVLAIAMATSAMPFVSQLTTCAANNLYAVTALML